MLNKDEYLSIINFLNLLLSLNTILITSTKLQNIIFRQHWSLPNIKKLKELLLVVIHLRRKRRHLTWKALCFILCLRFLKMRSFSRNAFPLLRQNFPNDKAPCRLTFFFIFGLWCRWNFFLMDGYTSSKNKKCRKKLVAIATIIKMPLGNSIKQQIVLTSDYASCSMYMMWLLNLRFNYIEAMDIRCLLKYGDKVTMFIVALFNLQLELFKISNTCATLIHIIKPRGKSNFFILHTDPNHVNYLHVSINHN